MTWRLAAIVLALSVLSDADAARLTAASHPQQTPPLFTHSLLHAHNCYPDQDRWADRIDRALATGLRPIAIEQDIAWAAMADATGRSVVVHDDSPTGREPTLEAYFFDKLRPVMEAALASPQPATWPLVVLHLDFKTNERAHHLAIWDLLGRYQRWLTTAPRVAGDVAQPFAVGPLLVLTENGAGQSAVFYDEVPVGEQLRIFGTVPPAVLGSPTTNREAQFDAAINASAQQLVPSGTTNYRRWINFSWMVVEHGGQTRAGDWTDADDRRLRAIVSRAHSLGLWIRFYTLNGHPIGGNDGWTASYNFGSIDAVRSRWRATIAAGVDFIATDQYEGLASLLADAGR